MAFITQKENQSFFLAFSLSLILFFPHLPITPLSPLFIVGSLTSGNITDRPRCRSKAQPAVYRSGTVPASNGVRVVWSCHDRSVRPSSLTRFPTNPPPRRTSLSSTTPPRASSTIDLRLRTCEDPRSKTTSSSTLVFFVHRHHRTAEPPTTGDVLHGLGMS